MTEPVKAKRLYRIVKHLVRTYYAFQDQRKALGGQLQNVVRDYTSVDIDRQTLQYTRHTLTEKLDEDELNEILNEVPRFWDVQGTYRDMYSKENSIKRLIAAVLDEEDIPIYDCWLQHVKGAGTITAAGLIAHIQDISRFDRASELLKYCGLHVIQRCRKCGKRYFETGKDREKWVNHMLKTHDQWNRKRLENAVCKCDDPDPHGVAPSRKRGQPISYVPELKTLCWKIGKNFVRQGDYYKDLYQEYKEEEVEGNKPKRIPLYAKSAIVGEELAETVGEHQSGTLVKKEVFRDIKKTLRDDNRDTVLVRMSRGHLDARARRKTVHVFIRHLWCIWRQLAHLPTTQPYPLEHGDHEDYIPPAKTRYLPERLRPFEPKYEP